jgi:predicted Rossmann fold flavoprotein
MAAASLPSPVQVTLFESGNQSGRKLLLSGSGRCNITHTGDVGDFLTHYGDNGKFLKAALYAFGPEALREFFRGRGLDFITREDGKIFPVTEKARSVLDCLLKACKNVKIVTGKKVLSIRKNSGNGNSDENSTKNNENSKNRGVFTITTTPDASVYEADKIILATGGLSFPSTGADGSGLAIAVTLGHSLTPPRPALCGVISGGCEILAGNSFANIGAGIFRAGRLIRRGVGDLLFTHRGVSGPLILNLSRFLKAGDTITLNFLHPTNPEEFLSRFNGMVKKDPHKTAGAILSAFPLTRALEDLILERCGIERAKTCAELSKAEMRRLAEHLVRFPVPVQATEGYNTAMVTAGGIRLDEVNPKTMESRVTGGLYFAGEILDIDGDEGGYNLQAAFSTGRLAAQSIIAALA